MILEEAVTLLNSNALRDLGFVDIGWGSVLLIRYIFCPTCRDPDDPDGDLLGFSLTLPNTYDMRRVRLMRTSKASIRLCEGKNGY